MSTTPQEKRLLALGQAVRDSRLQANWTQDYLAGQSGVSKATLRRLESGQSIQLANWLRILEALGLDTDAALSPATGPDPLAEIARARGAARTKRQRASGQPKSLGGGEGAAPWPWGEDR
ncbi:MAG: transcriptional regulator with XRE-family HTH domain [Gammaproteobacteria bacterium]|jgi:transcriptional regulator with XRE-family HTH domain